ncbi:MAG: AraC family transcriptional regulator [Leptospira sp.]|nr:AraC family transcriptional regulator [Leptospira sp.]
MRLEIIPIPKDLSHVVRRVFYLYDIGTVGLKLDIFADGNSCLILEISDDHYCFKQNLFFQGAILEPFKENLLYTHKIILMDFFPDSFYKLGLNPIPLVNRSNYFSHMTNLKPKTELFSKEKTLSKLFDLIRQMENKFGRRNNLLPLLDESPIDILSRRKSKFISYRHFEREFKKMTGYSIKTYNRIRRFQVSLNALDNLVGKKMIDTCLSLGYYDQSHFSKEFKEFSGYTPKEFLNLSKVDDSLYT